MYRRGQRCYDCSKTAYELRTKIQRVVLKAIMDGKLAPPRTLACADCGKAAYGYDHRDYDRPLDVEPICRSCNHKRGPAKQFMPGARA